MLVAIRGMPGFRGTYGHRVRLAGEEAHAAAQVAVGLDPHPLNDAGAELGRRPTLHQDELVMGNPARTLRVTQDTHEA